MIPSECLERLSKRNALALIIAQGQTELLEYIPKQFPDLFKLLIISVEKSYKTVLSALNHREPFHS